MDDRMRRRSGMRCVRVVGRARRVAWASSACVARAETARGGAPVCALFLSRFPSFAVLWFGSSREDRSRRGMGGRRRTMTTTGECRAVRRKRDSVRWTDGATRARRRD